ncbi:MAG: S41 family peptidase [Lachnospiraceae bacterium]|nr:S41 family peptidase [Lachnospiraceae bacterium]
MRKGYFVSFVLGAAAFAILITGVNLVRGNRLVKISNNNKVTEATDAKLELLQKYIETFYLETNEEKADKEDLENGIYKGYVSALNDPYSQYYTKEEYDDLMESTSGEYKGIGVVVSQNDETGVITMISVYDNTPAKEAGLEDGDILYKVEGKEVTGIDIDKVVGQIRGEEGTTVHIEIYRESTKEYKEFDVERRTIEVPTVYSEMLDEEKKIGYVKVTQFDSNTDEIFSKKMKELSSQGMKSVVFDLRNNPGGNYDTVCNMLDELLPEGTVVYTLDKSGKKEIETSDAACIDIPMVVLMNENSASASEIFAGAIQDYKAGKIVGTQSFGKGIVQSVFSLPDGSAIKLTVSKYYTPNGTNIHKKGITPDVKVEDNKDTEQDEQLDEALKQLENNN